MGMLACHSQAHGRGFAFVRASVPLLGEGEIRNGRNLERQNWAQQKCAKLCHHIVRSEDSLRGVVFISLGMHISIVPNSSRK